MAITPFRCPLTESELTSSWKVPTDKPLVSVNCSTFNHVQFIRDALNGFLSQRTKFPFQVVVHDDASTDGTREIVEEYARAYPRIVKAVLQPENLYSKGIKRSQYIDPLLMGQYVAFCEGDDYWTDETKLQKQVSFLEKNPNYAFCWTRFNLLHDESLESAEDFNGKYFPDGRLESREFGFREFCYTGWHIGMQTLVYRRVAKNHQHAKLQHYRDVFLIADLLHAGKGICLPDFTAVYRQHAGGVHTGATKAQRIIKAEQIYSMIAEVYPEHEGLLHKCRIYSNALIAHHIRNKQFIKAMNAAAKQARLTGSRRAWLHYVRCILSEQRSTFARVPWLRSVYRRLRTR